jgi:predicted deacylase
MASKRLVKLPIRDVHNDVETFVPLGIVEGRNPGPTLAVITGIHATEYVSQDGVARFWESLDPEEISGTVLVVLGADIKAMLAHHMWTNPIDGKRMGRAFPGNPDGTLTEVISYTLWEEAITQADAVIDCHGGEYSEDMHPYVITHATDEDEDLDQRTVDLAMDLGVPFVEVTHLGGVIGRRGGLTTEAVYSGRPGMVMEIGQRGERDPKFIAMVYQALQNALKHLGMKEGEPVWWAGKPVQLDHGIILNTTKAGLYEPAVVVGEWIEKDAVFARVRDFDGTLLEEVRAPEAGVVLTMINARCIDAGGGDDFLKGFAGKIGVVRGEDGD